MNYRNCWDYCADFVYDKSKKECTFRKLCISMELPKAKRDVTKK